MPSPDTEGCSSSLVCEDLLLPTKFTRCSRGDASQDERWSLCPSPLDRKDSPRTDVHPLEHVSASASSSPAAGRSSFHRRDNSPSVAALTHALSSSAS